MNDHRIVQPDGHPSCKETPCKPTAEALESKVPTRFFIILLSSLALFAIFVVGNSLSINSDVNKIQTAVKVVANSVHYQGTQINDLKVILKDHAVDSNARHKDHRDNIRNLERSMFGGAK